MRDQLLHDEVNRIRMQLQQDSFGPLLKVWEGADIARFHHQFPTLWAEIKTQPGAPLRIMVSSIEPQQTVAPHTDSYRGTRKHFPLTAPVHWWDEEGGSRVLPQFEWTGVNARVLHSVQNLEEVQRVTLIVDFSEITP